MYKEYAENHDAHAHEGEFWDRHWGNRKPDLARILSDMEFRDPLARYFDKQLPTSGRILEAGCGIGQYVAYLRRRNHPIEGMDFAAGAVAFAKENFPDVPFYIGDLNKIPVPDNTYSAIICLGVVEHFEEGPDRILAELRRVLAPEGVLHISVPYESLSFRLMNAIEGKNGFDKPKGPFYQYRFRKMEFKQALSKAGFSIGKVSYYGGIIGLKRRARFLKRLLFNRKKSHLENSVSSNARNGHQVSIFKTLKLRMLYPLVWFIETQLTFFAHMILITATPNKNHPPE